MIGSFDSAARLTRIDGREAGQPQNSQGMQKTHTLLVATTQICGCYFNDCAEKAASTVVSNS
jgi:hypothetical protein